MRRPALAACLVAAVLLPLSAPRAVERNLGRELAELLAGATQRERVARLLRLAWIEPADAALAAEAETWLRREAQRAESVLPLAFFDSPPAAQVKILDLYREQWDVLGRGTDPWRIEMLRVGLMSEEKSVRRAAARLLAAAHFTRVAHIAVDAAVADPDLTVAALLGIANDADPHEVRWVVRQALAKDPRVVAAAHYAIWRIGRPAAEHLQPLVLLDDDPATRRAALEALFRIASDADSDTLYEWLDRFGDQDPELRERVTDLLGRIEAGLYRPPRPPVPAQLFPDE